MKTLLHYDKMTSLGLLGLLALGVVAGSDGFERVQKRDVCSQYGDGCSIPFDLPFFYRTKFTPSCNRHDICYGCGALAGYSRSACDDYFLNNMVAACGRRRDVCTTTAQVYYQAVRSRGASRYKPAGSTESYCTTSLIAACVP